MAIYGAGSKWKKNELKDEFFKKERFMIGWDNNEAKDLYEAVSHLKVGDIIYLKGVSPRTIRNIKVKGIGIVTKSVIQCIQSNEYNNPSNKNRFFIKVKWKIQTEFNITIPNDEGKLTNIRPATFYEEYLPLVQEKILEKLFS